MFLKGIYRGSARSPTRRDPCVRRLRYGDIEGSTELGEGLGPLVRECFDVGDHGGTSGWQDIVNEVRVSAPELGWMEDLVSLDAY